MAMPLRSMPLDATFWREFHERPTGIYFMVAPEGAHHFRDAVSIVEISRVFPHVLTQVGFCPIIPGRTAIESPASGEGIVILGRPAHFRSELMQDWLTERLFPPLQFSFDSNKPGEEGYRTIRCLLTDRKEKDPERRIYTAPNSRESPSPSSLKEKEQERVYTAPNWRESPSSSSLEDYALVYLGQARIYENDEPVPCLILSGTSTLGTWGASVFATSLYYLEKNVGVSPWFQGVLSVALKRPSRNAPFQRSNLALHVPHSFFRAYWVEVVYSGRAAEKEWRKNVAFQVFVDDRMVTTDSDTWRCFIALALEQQDRPGQFIQVREVEARLRQAFAPPSLMRVPPSLNVPARLHDAVRQLRHHGVYIEKTPDGYHLLLAGFEETVM